VLAFELDIVGRPKGECKVNSLARHEIEHGKLLAGMQTEEIWGWDTPAGRLRANRRADLIIRGGHLTSGIQALEVGCGTGMFTELFAQTGARLVAVDISGDLLQKAIARKLPERITFLEKRFEDCEVDGPFDAVIGSSVLHHLDTDESFAKIYALLRPGGRMSFAEPNMLNPQVFVERRFRRWFPYVSPDETAFVRWRLAGVLSRAGFEKIEITPFDWLHPSTPVSMIDPVKRIGRWLERIPIVRELAGSLWICARRPSNR
jgi:2-polyprenyl-3-methyl-5-hydroxy-6-metoxy-1,4-benzoquinol methylase